MEHLKADEENSQFLQPVKDARDLLSSCDVYRVPCSNGHIYIGTTKRSVHTINGESRRCCLGQPEKCGVAVDALTHGDHRVLFEEAQVLSSIRGNFVRLVREAFKINKHTSFPMNRRCWRGAVRDKGQARRSRLHHAPNFILELPPRG